MSVFSTSVVFHAPVSEVIVQYSDWNNNVETT